MQAARACVTVACGCGHCMRAEGPCVVVAGACPVLEAVATSVASRQQVVRTQQLCPERVSTRCASRRLVLMQRLHARRALAPHTM